MTEEKSPFGPSNAVLGARRCVALVPAAGVGVRLAGSACGVPKQYLLLDGKTMLWTALRVLADAASVHAVYVVLAPDDAHWCPTDYADLDSKLVVLRCGGNTRAQTVANGLRAICADGYQEDTRILVHDAARPCITTALVDRLLREAGDSDAGGLLATPVADTLKLDAGPESRLVERTISRASLWQAQTPQVFPLDLLMRALAAAPAVTDESSAIEALGLHPRLVASDPTNFKVTYPGDLALAEMILRSRRETAEARK